MLFLTVGAAVAHRPQHVDHGLLKELGRGFLQAFAQRGLGLRVEGSLGSSHHLDRVRLLLGS